LLQRFAALAVGAAVLLGLLAIAGPAELPRTGGPLHRHVPGPGATASTCASTRGIGRSGSAQRAVMPIEVT
jgi:hypothetical protein